MALVPLPPNLGGVVAMISSACPYMSALQNESGVFGDSLPLSRAHVLPSYARDGNRMPDCGQGNSRCPTGHLYQSKLVEVLHDPNLMVDDPTTKLYPKILNV